MNCDRYGIASGGDVILVRSGGTRFVPLFHQPLFSCSWSSLPLELELPRPRRPRALGAIVSIYRKVPRVEGKYYVVIILWEYYWLLRSKNKSQVKKELINIIKDRKRLKSQVGMRVDLEVVQVNVVSVFYGTKPWYLHIPCMRYWTMLARFNFLISIMPFLFQSIATILHRTELTSNLRAHPRETHHSQHYPNYSRTTV
jgi:hypothetical protein